MKYTKEETADPLTIEGQLVKEMTADPINPEHYRLHPSGVECIQITEYMNFNIGNAMKYIWRSDLAKNDIQDLQKAVWYLQREIELRTAKNITKVR